MKRRHFIKSAVMGVGAMGLNKFPHHLYAGDRKKFAHDRVILGNTSIEVSRMAMGTGTSGWNGRSNQTRNLGIRGLSDLLRNGYDNGITFFESADQYGSHPHIREALKKIPREKVVILTKTIASTADEMKEDLSRFRKELGTDYIDIILLHFQRAVDWNIRKKGVMEVLSQAREEGIIRAHGVSSHSLEAMKTAIDEPWVQVMLSRFNPGEARMDGSIPVIRQVLENYHEKGKGVIQMKVFGGGDLTNKQDDCLQFALGHSCVDSFTIGIEQADQLTDLLERIPAASVRG
ncbi:MAG: aldo/keto reductase [Bacteroides sp. SM23_62]|nr:MAG: aldo/keto reductase [Bacteroides sp. SM23_62]